MKTFLLLSLLFLLVGCKGGPKYSGPFRKCLKSHTDVIYYHDAALNMMMPMYVDTCDEYSKEEYISVDNAVYEVKRVK